MGINNKWAVRPLLCLCSRENGSGMNLFPGGIMGYGQCGIGFAGAFGVGS